MGGTFIWISVILYITFPRPYVCCTGPGVPSTATKAKSEKPATSSLHQALNASHNQNTATAYHPTQLANALNYSYNPLLPGAMPTNSAPSTAATFPATGFPVRGFPASCTKVVSSDRALPGSVRGLGGGGGGVDWSGFGDVGSSVEVKKSVQDAEQLTSKRMCADTQSSVHKLYMYS